MDNENNNNVAAEAARPVRKLVLKRKPVVKKAPQIVETDESAAVQETLFDEKTGKPETIKAEENASEETPRKKRGRKPKQKTEEQAVTVKPEAEEADKAAIEPETSEPADKPAEAMQEESLDYKSDSKADSKQEEDNQEERDQRRFGNRNQRNGQKNKNRNFDNSGKYNARQDPRGNQKKTMTMDDISIGDAEYKEHLSNRMIINEVSSRPFDELKERLAELTGQSEDDFAEYKKQDVILELLKTFSRNGGVIYATGTLEILSDGYGFLRSPLNSYLSGPEDVYVSPAIIKFLNLKTGDTIEGMMRTPKDNERFFAIAKIATVNGDAPIVAKTRTGFDSLIPLYPDERINLETERTDNDVSMRIINLFCPIGKGQRALITAPPRTGKTILLQQIANAITANHPEIKLMVLLVDERPEEVTDMRRNVKGEVIASTFDEQATRHVTVAEMVIEKAKRLVEHGKDVVILLDSITRLARAYNQTVPASGKILSGGVDSNALHKPKRFFGAARNIENGGSLTIIASALIETGSRMDEVIFEEFKGTGNSEIVLDRRMADRRLYPAINIKKSGTRREDLLLSKDEAARIWILRNAINGLEDLEMTEFLIDKMRKTKNNEAFLRSMNTGTVPEF